MNLPVSADIEAGNDKTTEGVVRSAQAALEAGAGKPSIAELEQIGVARARVSFGPRPMRAGLALIRKIAMEIKSLGTYSNMEAETISYSEVNNWFKKNKQRGK